MRSYMDAINFNDIKEHIIGSYTVTDWFSFVMYSDTSPSRGDVVDVDGVLYEVETVVDVTEEDEREQGLSYDRVWLIKV